MLMKSQAHHLIKLFEQVESQICNYSIKSEEVEEALAIIRINNFDGESNFKTDIEGRLYRDKIHKRK